MNILKSLSIIRPFNIILSIISVLTAAYLIDSLIFPLLIYTIIVVISFVAASNILNDIFDISIDQVNRPERPLVVKALSLKMALFFSIILYIIGIYFCLFINPLGMYIAIYLVLPITILYTPILKKIPFIGNIFIGIVLGAVFIFTEAALLGTVDNLLIPFTLILILTTIRELCKDGEDLLGDKLENVNTFPNKYGLLNTILLLRILSVILFIISLLPFIYNIYSFYYLLTLVSLVLLPLFYGIFVFLNYQSNPKDFSKLSKLLKLITCFGIFVLFSTKI